LYVLALSTGMRQGELLGLRWREVDLDRATARVTATLQKTGARLELAAPKTHRSKRQIALTPSAVSVLHAHRARQAEERLRAGAAWADWDLVFCNQVGGPLQKGNVLVKDFVPLLKRAGVRRVRFHDLRHTAATLLLGRGVPVKVVSELLGHASIAITLDVYAHVLPDMQAQAAEVMEAALGTR
ncbi:MAG TPA: site-specific integrase, partial [Ktedonobacterales bacterium]|nr:site-specific integrase [Ktedonobacterales bacterium]